MKVWLLTRTEDDYDTSLEVVNAYATEAMAKDAAEAENIDSAQWDGEALAGHGHLAQEMKGRIKAPTAMGMARGAPYVWHVIGLDVIEAAPVSLLDVAVAEGLTHFDNEGHPVFKKGAP